MLFEVFRFSGSKLNEACYLRGSTRNALKPAFIVKPFEQDNFEVDQSVRELPSPQLLPF